MFPPVIIHVRLHTALALKHSGFVSERREISHGGYRLVELESGAIQVWSYGKPVAPALPVLRKVAIELGLTLVNPQGNPYNTRALGSRVLDALAQRWGTCHRARSSAERRLRRQHVWRS